MFSISRPVVLHLLHMISIRSAEASTTGFYDLVSHHFRYFAKVSCTSGPHSPMASGLGGQQK
jgi:hypothetical protein